MTNVPDSKNVSAPILSTKKRLLYATATIVGIIGVLVLIQKMITPSVDASMTKAVTISDSTGDGQSVSTDGNSGSPIDLVSAEVIAGAEHPIDPVLEILRAGIDEIDKTITDYTATIISQVFVDDKLYDEKYVFCKIRHEQTSVDGETKPFAVYTEFLKPEDQVGQEAIWVDGKNDGKIAAHATGLLNVRKIMLDPDGSFAMKGNRYPIRHIGFRNLSLLMIELGEKDRAHDECDVRVKRGVQLNGRTCTVLEVVHSKERPHFGFHIGRIYVDDELKFPIAYEGYRWPIDSDSEPPLLERYYYTDLKFNVGLTESDFDPDNEAYEYPSW